MIKILDNHDYRQLNPIYFEGNNECREKAKHKYFFYGERDPLTKTIFINGRKLKIKKPFEVKLTGSITSPERAISRNLLAACYEKEEMMTSDAVGWIFIYKTFRSYTNFLTESAAVTLIFQVYPLYSKKKVILA